MRKIAISIGDLNGVGFEIAINSHNYIKSICQPIYCISKKMANRASAKLCVTLPEDFYCIDLDGDFEIEAGVVTKQSGAYSYDSFLKGVELVKNQECEALVTLPINKESWHKAGIYYAGHTEALRDIFKQEAIMVMGLEELYVALYTEHIPLRDVVLHIKKDILVEFLLRLQKYMPKARWGVLGLNPHAGDNGVIGDEDKTIKEAILETNTILKNEIFFGPLVPDIAFTKHKREYFSNFVAMYHDQGLAPLKALYFDESINISLALPIVRTSVGHGSAFDIAYKSLSPSNKSYINAIVSALHLVSRPFHAGTKFAPTSL